MLTHIPPRSYVPVNALGSTVGLLGSIPGCIFCPNPYKPVHQGNVGLITRFGRFTRAVDPGLVKVNPLSEKLVQVDVKIQIVGRWPEDDFVFLSPPGSLSLEIACYNVIPNDSADAGAIHRGP